MAEMKGAGGVAVSRRRGRRGAEEEGGRSRGACSWIAGTVSLHLRSSRGVGS